MLEEPPPKPTGKGGAEGTENPELAHRLHQQKITASRGRGGRFALRVGPTHSHPEANPRDVRSVMNTSHRNPSQTFGVSV